MFFFFVFILILIIGYVIYTSRIGIEVKDLNIDTEKPKGEKIDKNSKIYVYIVIFNKIKILKKDIMKIKEIELKMEDKFPNINLKELVQNIEIDIIEVDLDIKISTKNAEKTAIFIGILYGILSCILRKPKYKISALYKNKNLLKIKLNGIFSIYLMQYIYKVTLKKIKKKIDLKFNFKEELER